MPIHIGAEIRRMGDEEFKARVFDVMGYVFDVQAELGRLFHEKIYQREIALRIPDAQREVPVELRFEDFCKTYYLDLLVGGGAVFELKTVEGLTREHERQLMHYLFLTDLPHGKLVNLRPQRVDHKFVNNVMSATARTAFAIEDQTWQEIETRRLKERMISVLRDWGVGLGIALYEEAALHFSGRASEAEVEVSVSRDTRPLGVQRMLLAAPRVAVRITTLAPKHHAAYHADLRLLLDHTDLRAIQWINITQHVVQFRTIWKRT